MCMHPGPQPRVLDQHSCTSVFSVFDAACTHRPCGRATEDEQEESESSQSQHEKSGMGEKINDTGGEKAEKARVEENRFRKGSNIHS